MTFSVTMLIIARAQRTSATTNIVPPANDAWLARLRLTHLRPKPIRHLLIIVP
jgi:hypothetical protein